VDGGRLRWTAATSVSPPMNDYVTWIVLGLAGIGGVLALIIR
jgi:hypothetical protein